MMFTNITDPSERVRAICNYGCTVDVDHTIQAVKYVRSGHMIIQMADVYFSEKDFESAFILYSKFITLFVERLPKHPEYSTIKPAEKNKICKSLKEVFEKAEKAKVELMAIYELAELDRQKIIALEEEQYLLERHRLLADQQKREEQEHMDFMYAVQLNELQIKESKPPVSTHKSPASNAIIDKPVSLYTESRVPYVNPASQTPLPSLPSLPAPFTAAKYHPDPSPLTPLIHRDLKPSVSHFTSSSGCLRVVNIPASLTDRFLDAAAPNTSVNNETCGILCGFLSKNEFSVTTVVIPKQSNSSDSCNMLNEEELFEVQDKRDLITLGWIHTHPSQTAFLSSVDLHTQASYQSMLPEAIAIVCSVKFKELGFFTLTPNHGLNEILKCKLKGFHPHSTDPPIFQQSSHFKISQDLKLQIIDLR